MQAAAFANPSAVADALDGAGYLPDEGLATAAFLAMRMGRPLFLEGDPGVGKTALAQALATITDAELLRLQCYEGIDASQALYDWDFPRQILHLRAAGDSSDTASLEASLYERRFLVARPILQAIERSPSVLLIDEIDRADDEFEAFLLEVLAENSVTIPELGTITAEVPPLVVITSNRTREVHDALKRRCLYHWVAHPDFQREVAIIRRRMPEISESLARDVALAVGRLREAGLLKPPGIAETIDWAQALHVLGAQRLDSTTAGPTLGAVLKYHEDIARVQRELDALLGELRPVSSNLPDPVVAMTGFARALRAQGIAADTTRLTAALDALGHVDVLDARQVYWAGRVTMCAEPDDLPRYDAVFDAWFRGRVASLPGPAPSGPPAQVVTLRPIGTGPGTDEAETDDQPLRTAASDAEVLRHHDIADLSAVERDEINRLIALLAPRMGSRRTRRRRPRGRDDIDVRRTVRLMLHDGGEPAELARLRPRRKPRRLVLLLDVSGSMSAYADVLLRFAHAAVRVAPTTTEVFTVSTRLTRVTRQLRLRDPELALRAAGTAIPDWSGGTRLGESLRAFLDLWGQRGTARRAVVVVASDGWERGDTDLLGEQMSRLARLAHRVVWVNPHRGKDGFAPVTAGMVAALPHCDHLLAGHTLDALHTLADVIADA